MSAFHPLQSFLVGDYSAIGGRYSQTIDAKGTIYARDFNRLTGAPYDVAMDKEEQIEQLTCDDFHFQSRD